MIETQALSVRYNGKPALHDVTLQLGDGFVAVIGPSGAGKSTLMRALNGLVPASAGAVWHDGVRLGRPGSAELRRQQAGLGMIFQQFNLVRRLSALDNVLIGRLGHRAAWRSALRTHNKRRNAVCAASSRPRRPGRPGMAAGRHAQRRAAAAGGHRQGAGPAAQSHPGR